MQLGQNGCAAHWHLPQQADIKKGVVFGVEGEGMTSLFNTARAPRGISNTAAIIIALLVVLVFGGVIRWIIGAVTGLLFLLIQLAVMILVFIALVYVIKAVAKKAT